MSRLSVFVIALLVGVVLLSAPAWAPLQAQSAPDAPVPVGTRLMLPYIKAASATPTPVVDFGQMIAIPAGSFQMGCDASHDTCNSEELPLHTVTLSAYSIDKYEVTNARYKACVDAGGCTPPHETSSAIREAYYGNAAYNEYPVIKVDWSQAAAYCAWAGKRLPAEAEWEKAARGASDTRVYPWGDSAPNCTMLNFAGGVTGACVGDTSQVGAYPNAASSYGAVDMAGNVWEWVRDWWQADYYSVSPANNPTGPATVASRVLRGGAWNHTYDWNVRTAYRNYIDPDYWVMNLGFRCARSQ
jgi:formylglycine-generating enzyme required for sulfatase activity